MRGQALDKLSNAMDLVEKKSALNAQLHIAHSGADGLAAEQSKAPR
jgi:hypothetical protein